MCNYTIESVMANIEQERITITHVRITIEAEFDAFTAQIEQRVGRFDPQRARAASAADLRATLEGMQGEQGLMLFGKQDHGALFALQGAPRKAYRYHIGNPLIAFSMTRHEIRAGLYAPLSVFVREIGPTTLGIDFDLPSSLFGQFGVADVTAVGWQLDAKLKRLIESAAGLHEHALDAA
jgi:hypothetical protein